ncbi:aldo/keto reductase [Aureimonas jatrophae]|jgi:aryl-alcohol dehydrogenase-like predicted oxidoreductase|uniref:Predicted oxidoreductase n=1 Tax=Aureimonas jatrophae TaxID=1166073 RepID=A0A1H0K0Y4_9HYPH|nr:aldo/keto reductase [Aureimonas jatrophae]MBB3950900.1 aryl-alcohol dehydrogenase-like predicted oxidoreductase [Aureimonas jatrophae]SDO49698.1 Predicted oxidoreductase [Aureimonas jatrophae]
MKQRDFGRTGWRVGEIGFGAWAIGGSWGDVSEDDAVATLHAALDSGVTFLDTADVYGDGRSERLIARVLRERGDAERPLVATKAGRRLQPHAADGYTLENLERFVDRSLSNLEVETLDLVQLHCPPTEVYDRPEVFGAMDRLVEKGKIRFHGVSVERVDEALRAIRQPGVVSVQIIYNLFRQRPADDFFPAARAANTAVIVRVPLASGLLTGRIDRSTQFASDDHRNFNRHGESFDVGETFSGVPFEAALEAVEALRPLVPGNAGGMAAFALRWILMEDAVSVVIPGGRRAEQARGNAAAGDLAALPAETMAAAREIYDRIVAPHVHARW